MLSSQERKFFADRLRQLEQLGFAMPFEYRLLDRQRSEVFVEQCSSVFDCPVFDLDDRGTLYLVWLSLVAERPGITLFDFRFVPPWSDREFQKLPSFADSSVSGAYILPNTWTYPKEDILNFHFGKTGWRLPCTPVEGLLCARSATPIPEELEHGALIPMDIRFFGKSGKQLAETTVTLWTDRDIDRKKSGRTAAELARSKPAVEVDDDREEEPSATALRSSHLYDGGELNNRSYAEEMRARYLEAGALMSRDTSRFVRITPHSSDQGVGHTTEQIPCPTARALE